VGEPLYRHHYSCEFGFVPREFPDLTKDLGRERVEVYDLHPQRLVKQVVSHDDSGDGIAYCEGALRWDVSQARSCRTHAAIAPCYVYNFYGAKVYICHRYSTDVIKMNTSESLQTTILATVEPQTLNSVLS